MNLQVSPNMVNKNTNPTSPEAYAKSIVRESGTSFFWAMRSLKSERRRSMYAIYAFCRDVDDIVDDPGQSADKHLKLQAWREDIERLYDSGDPASLIGRALIPAKEVYGCHKRDFLAVIDGMTLDAGQSLRIKTDAELALYCDRVAAAVGRLSNRIFGLDDEHGDPIADTLGQALQRTNILRDILEDAKRDRLYIPEDRLVAAGLDIAGTAPLDQIIQSPVMISVCQDLLDDTGQRFDRARKLINKVDSRVIRPAKIMMAVYEQVYRRLQARGFEKLHEPVALNKFDKLLLGLRCTLFVQ